MFPVLLDLTLQLTYFSFKLVFTKTRILSVKVSTLQTFLHMVKTLDQVRTASIPECGEVTNAELQTSLTQKLVPLLSRIRTKEPAVMVSILSVLSMVFSLRP
jgi:SCY1-like protein 2